MDVLDAGLTAIAEVLANLGRKNPMSRWSALAPLALAAACASAGSVRNAAPELGKDRWFDTCAVDLLDIARNALLSAKYKIREQKQQGDTTWYIIATRGTRFSLCDLLDLRCSRPYEVVRIRIVGSAPDSTHVWAHRKEDLITIGGAEEILAQMDYELCLRRLRLPFATPPACLRVESLDVGVVREFAGDYATVLRATRTAVTSAGLAIDSYEEVNDSTAMIVAKKGASAWSWGELVRVVVQRSTTDRVAVRVLTRRRIATNVTAKGDYSEVIFSNIELALR